MGVFEMVVIIVAISVIGGVVSKSIKIKYETTNKSNENDNAVTEQRLAELEKRVIVLEKIVTSESYQLKQQFENIDDK